MGQALAYEAVELQNIAIEDSLPKSVPWIHPSDRDLREKAMEPTVPEEKDPSNYSGNFKQRRDSVTAAVEVPDIAGL
jgi:hypothetical protein